MTDDQIQQLIAAILGMVIFIILLPAAIVLLMQALRYTLKTLHAFRAELGLLEDKSLYNPFTLLLRSDIASAQGLNDRVVASKYFVGFLACALLMGLLAWLGGFFG